MKYPFKLIERLWDVLEKTLQSGLDWKRCIHFLSRSCIDNNYYNDNM